jgi:hypothetical protein
MCMPRGARAWFEGHHRAANAAQGREAEIMGQFDRAREPLGRSLARRLGAAAFDFHIHNFLPANHEASKLPDAASLVRTRLVRAWAASRCRALPEWD